MKHLISVSLLLLAISLLTACGSSEPKPLFNGPESTKTSWFTSDSEAKPVRGIDIIKEKYHELVGED